MATISPERLAVGRPRAGAIRAMLASPMASYYLVLGSVLPLIGVGQLMALSSSSVYAISQGLGAYYFAIRQAVFLVAGIPLAIWLSRRSERFLMKLAWPALFGAVLLLLAMFIPGLGEERKGNRAWINLGAITIQPAEFAKLALVLWAAAVLSVKQRLLDQPRHLFFPLAVGFLIPIGLILAGGDLGTGLVVVVLMFGVLWVVGAPMRVFATLLAGASVVVGFLVVTSPNRMQRITNFLANDPTDANVSQQPLSAVYALATGGWFGVGLGASRQKWGGLYDGAQNDYVFAVLGEELGLVGTVCVLLLLGVLAYAGIRIASHADTLFVRVLAGGITVWLMFQALLNIGVAMRLVPVVGVPLPFVSVGGSALMANLLAAGLLLACARHEPAARRVIEAAKRKSKPRVTRVVDHH